MRSLVLLAAATLAATGAALPVAVPASGQDMTDTMAPPSGNPQAAQVRAGVDAWTGGDYDAAVKAWQGPAAKGDADALFNMGQAYKLGRGTPKDLPKAEAMYGKAASLGHIRAADNYGILLFQTGRQQAAVPWLQTAADRGEPRAMYVLGIAAYNGDFAPKDWIKAYALITRAAGTGLPQAISSLATMNETIPLAQRQMGVSLAGELERKATETRGRQLAAADLGTAGGPGPMSPRPPKLSLPAARSVPAARSMPGSLEQIDLPPSAPVNGDYGDPVGKEADYAPPPAPRPAVPKPTVPKPVVSKPATAIPIIAKPFMPRPVSDSGPYRIQLGAFGIKANADALWSRVRGRAEIAGHPRADLGNPVTRLLANGYSQAGAQRACAALKAGGFACLVINP